MDSQAWDRRYGATELLWSAGPNGFVEAELAGLPPGRALDLAAGEGRNSIWLAQRGFDVEAVDFSKVALERGEQLAKARQVQLHWHHADLLSFTPPARHYDLVLIAYLQLPWAQLSRVLSAAAAAVAPGGTFLLVGHHRDNLERGHGGPSDAKVLYTAEQIAGELGELSIDKAQCVERTVQTDTGPRVALDALVRATRPAG